MAIKHMPRDFVVRISSDSGLGKSFMKPKGVRIHGCFVNGIIQYNAKKSHFRVLKFYGR